jgi:NAD(P)-dependent dehydrogenase (short-subunit alcohol dehydrogenase family)
MTALTGKRVVVIGGTSGIGFATADLAAREGATVVVASSRQDRVDDAVAHLPAGTTGHVVDVSREDAIGAFFARVGPFDHLAYTAGDALFMSPLASTDFDAARRFWNIRYWGALAAAKHAAPRINPGGSIVLSTGIAGRRPQPGWTVVASLCGAMESLARALAVELAPIRVNAVSPGIVHTPLWDSVPDADREALYQSVAATLPVRRIGTPADIALTYLYLMREGYSTGQTIVVDGGGVLV